MSERAARRIIRFTQEEDLVILRELQQYPDNLTYGLLKAAEVLTGRSLKSVKNRYYNTLRNSEDFMAVTCGSKEGFTHNVKNTPRVEGEFPEDRSLNTVEWLMKKFLDLPKNDRDKIFNFFISTGSINIDSPRIAQKGNNNKGTIR